MVKARLCNRRHIGVNDIILLGLSEENIKRLKQDQPIYFRGKDLGVLGVDIAIVYGETELEIVDKYGLDSKSQAG